MIRSIHKIKKIAKCFTPLYLYICLHISFIIMLVSILAYMSDENGFSLSDNENLLVAIFSGIICTFVYRNEIKIIFGQTMIEQLAKINFKHIIMLLAYSILIRMVMVLPFSFLYFVNKDMDYSYSLLAGGSLNTVLSLISVCFVAPIVEEVMFRGIILDRLSRIVTYRIANILQALIFSLIHFNLLLIITSIILGYVQGELIRRYKSIGAPIVLHIFFNCFGFIFHFI